MKTALVGIATLVGFIVGFAILNQNPDSTVAPILLSVSSFGLFAWLILLWLNRDRAWLNRPQRLCTNCLTLAQPFRKDNGVLYCPHCQADNPAPLESPFARDYFARQQPQA